MTDPIDLEALRAALDYFSQRQDAEYHTDSPTATPNEEMRHAVTLGAVFAELTTRRARDAEVEALVERWRTEAKSISGEYEYSTIQAEQLLDCATELANLTGAAP